MIAGALLGVGACVGAPALSACGRIGYEPVSLTRPQPLCDWREGTPTFGAAVRLPDPIDLSSTESDPFVDEDGSLWFSSDRSGSVDLWVARARGDGTFEDPVLASDFELGAETADRGLYVLEDRIAVHSSARAGEAEALYFSQRDETDAWAPPVAVLPGPASLRRHFDPFLGVDPIARQLHLVWAADRNPSTIAIHTATRSVDDAFEPVFSSVARLDLGGDGNDSGPSLDVSLSILVFTSTRGGSTGLWYVTRADPESGFGAATAVPELVPGDDRDAFLTPDGCRLWLVGGEGELYRADVVR